MTAIYQLWFWLTCKQFQGILQYSQNAFTLHLEEYIHNDKEVSLLLTRIIHNKITVFTSDFLNTYLRFFDSNFLFSFLTIVGVFGFLLGLWYVKEKRKNKIYLGLVVLVMVIPFIEVAFSSFLPYLIRLLLIWISFQSLAFSGLTTFLIKAGKNKLIFFSILLAFSFSWIVVFADKMMLFCIK